MKVGTRVDIESTILAQRRIPCICERQFAIRSDANSAHHVERRKVASHKCLTVIRAKRITWFRQGGDSRLRLGIQPGLFHFGGDHGEERQGRPQRRRLLTISARRGFGCD